MPAVDTGRHHNLLVPGTRVEMWVQLDRSWANGFEIHDLTDEGYVVRRLGDGALLPRVFPVGSVRAART